MLPYLKNMLTFNLNLQTLCPTIFRKSIPKQFTLLY